MAACIRITILISILWAAPAWAADGEQFCELKEFPAAVMSTQDIVRGPFEIKLKNGLVFYLSPEPTGAAAKKFAKFTVEEKTKFYKRRHEMLSLVANAVAFPRAAGGFAIASDKVRACWGKENISIAQRLAELTIKPGEVDAGNLKKRGQEAIAELLQIFDALIWEDASVFVGAKQVSFSTFVGVGNGIAVWGVGFYHFGGVQMDVGYNFETEKKFIQFSWLKQTLKGAYVLYEQMLTVGLFRQYQLNPTIKYQEGTHIAVPPTFAYQRGENMVAGGVVGGLHLAYALSAYLGVNGDVGIASMLFGGAWAMGAVSTFWTDLTKKAFYRHEYEKSYAERIKGAWSRWFGGCDEDLSSKK